MREIVIVLADLYLTGAGSASQGGRAQVVDTVLPGLDQAVRFGEIVAVNRAWRPWLAAWAGRPDLARAQPASIAAAAAAGAPQDSSATAWIATPLHLAAGMTTLHADFRSRLYLPPAELAQLARDFANTFHDSGFHLEPLESGDFLLFLPSVPAAQTTEPARLVVADVAASLPTGLGAAYLRRLGAEIEMWLHSHPLNLARAARRQPPVSTLWLWGGGSATLAGSAAPPHPPVLAFAADAYVHGLWRLLGNHSRALPEQLDAVFGYPDLQQAAVVLEVGQALRTHESWTVLDALAETDRLFIAPAIQALRRGLDRVSILANDRHLVVNARDHLKLWRRPRAALDGLQ